jgi:outer membrane protein OmpA-like peptidoglycan-associated protein
MWQRSRSSCGTLLLAIAACVGLVVASGWQVEAFAQDIRSSLFVEADQAMQESLAQRADILVPKSFSEGMKRYRKAEEDLERGRNLDGIRKELAQATTYFQRALEGTKLAQVTLASAIAARDDAASADAPRFALEPWRNADKKFREAAERLEDGDVKSAQRRGGESETLFRSAELEAIKANFLKETWSLLETADKLDVEKRAPKTLRRAQELVDNAERELSENRYDSDEPRSLAQEANYEARHALYLASIVESVDKENKPLEDLLLASEQPLQQIAGSLDIRAQFDEGPDKTTEQILEEIALYEDSVQNLNSRLSAEGQQIASLEARVAELEADLGGVQQERSQLAEAVAAQARLRERFAHVEGMFSRDEARVMREGNDVIIRLTGLTFASGKAVIEPQYFGLLTSVQRAIGEFPGSRVSIEGHTDSFGGDDQNLALSQQRADAVREYLLAHMQLTPTMVDAIGYGETRPVASNETPEGRARNRRIEVIVHPDMATASR